MSKKKTIILSVIILSIVNIFLSSFFFIGKGSKEISINSRNKNTEMIKNVTPENKYKLEFAATNDYMNKIRIGCKIPEKQKLKGNLCYKLVENESEIIVAEGKHKISNIMIRGEINILFEDQPKSGGKSYVLEFYLEDAPEDINWIMWANHLNKTQLQQTSNSEFLQVDLISAASYATKTKPLLWDSLLIFSVVIYLSAIFYFKEEKGK